MSRLQIFANTQTCASVWGVHVLLFTACLWLFTFRSFLRQKKTQEKHPWSKHGTTMSENESMVTTKWHFTYSLIPRVVSRHNKMLSFKQTKLALWSLFFFSFGSKNSVHQILESNTDGTFCNQTMQLCTFAKPFVIIFKIFPCDKSLVTQSVNIHFLFSAYSFNVILLHKCFRNA